MLNFMIGPLCVFVNGSKAERAAFCQKMVVLGFQIKPRANYDILAIKNVRSISSNHITVHQDNGTRITWGKGSPSKVLEAMKHWKMTGYIRYKGKHMVDYHQSVKRGVVSRPTQVWETWHSDEPWFPLSPKLEGWVEIVQHGI